MYTTTFSNTATLSVLGGSVTATIQISNQSSSKTMYIASISGGIGVPLNVLSSFTGSTILTSGGTLTSPGTLTPFNTNFSSSAASAMTAHSSTSAITSGTTITSFPLGGGQFYIPFSGGLIIPPAKSIGLNFNASLSVAGTLTTTTNLSWWEY